LATGLSGISPSDTANLIVVAQLRADSLATTKTSIPVAGLSPSTEESSDSDEEEASTNTMIAGAINGLISGEFQEVTVQEPHDFHSVNLPLDTTVLSKLKSKIGADEFIDLKALSKASDEEQFTLTVRKAQSSSSISGHFTKHSSINKRLDSIGNGISYTGNYTLMP